MDLERIELGNMQEIVDKESALGQIKLTNDERRKVEDLPVRIKKTAWGSVYHEFAVTQAWRSADDHEGIECWPDPRTRYGLFDSRLWLEIDPKRSAEVRLVEVGLVPTNVLVRLIHNGQLFTIHL